MLKTLLMEVQRSYQFAGSRAGADSASSGRIYSGVVRQALLCFVGILSIFLLTYNGHDNSEEGDYSYRVAKQILLQHRLSFDEKPQGVFNRAPNGLFYESYELGNSLAMLPMTWFNEKLHIYLAPRIGETKALLVWRFFFGLLSPVYCAAGLAFIFALLRIVFGQTPQRALINVALLGFCSFYWNYSRNLSDPVLCGTLLCAGTLFLFLYGLTLEAKHFTLAMAILGLGMITRLTMLIPIVGACSYAVIVLWFEPKRLVRHAIAGITALLPFAVWQAYYNQLRTGSKWVSPLQAFYAADNAFTGSVMTHLPALVISPGKGVLVYAPPVLLAILCFPAFFRRYRAEAIYTFVVGIGWLLLHAKLAGNWFGSWGWGPRHFITIVPVAAIPFLVSRREVFRKAPTRVFEGICLTFGFVLAAAATIGDWLYREEYAATKGQLDRLWSFSQSASVDMIVSSARNIGRLFTPLPFDLVAGASQMNQQASNTVNIWLITAHRQGVPLVPLVAVALALGALATASFWLLLHSNAGSQVRRGRE